MFSAMPGLRAGSGSRDEVAAENAIDRTQFCEEVDGPEESLDGSQAIEISREPI
jgi:hypothetical protein